MNAKIYIVEDDPLIMLDIKSILQGNGYEIVGQTDTAEIAVLEIPHIKPDLVLMDVNIKGNMDGIEVVSELNKLCSVPVIFLTALSDEGTLSRAKLTRPFGYIVKPFEADDIIATIEIAQSRFESESLDLNVEKDRSNEDVLPDFVETDEDRTITIEQLSTIKAFSTLSESSKLQLVNASHVKSFGAGEIIMESESRDMGFVVLGGRIGIMATSFSGKDLISTLLGPGDAYGLFFVLKDFSDKIYAKAQVDSKILKIPSNILKGLLKDSIEFNQQIVLELTGQLTKCISIAHALAFSKVEGRIINALLALIESFGKKIAGGDVNAGRLFITRKELADFTGTTPETAIRVTKGLERSGLLDLTKPGIIKILDIEALRTKTYE